MKIRNALIELLDFLWNFTKCADTRQECFSLQFHGLQFPLEVNIIESRNYEGDVIRLHIISLDLI
jgi:hypothetical protein